MKKGNFLLEKLWQEQGEGGGDWLHGKPGEYDQQPTALIHRLGGGTQQGRQIQRSINYIQVRGSSGNKIEFFFTVLFLFWKSKL